MLDAVKLPPRIEAVLTDGIKELKSIDGQDAKVVANAFANSFETTMIKLVNSSDIPKFQKDEAITVIKNAVAKAQQEVPEGTDAISDDAATDINDAVDVLKAEITYIMKTTPNKGDSWLMILAAALGQIADEKLEIMMDKADKLNDASTTDEDGKVTFGSDSGQLTAASKVFAIIQETMTNVIKTTGDGITTAARK